MEIKIKEIGDVTVIKIIGEVDLYHAPDIIEKVKECCDNNKLKVVIDLEKVTYIDSSGISSLISSLSSLKELGGDLKIIHVYDNVKRIFSLTKLTSFFNIYDSESKAIEDFKD